MRPYPAPRLCVKRRGPLTTRQLVNMLVMGQSHPRDLRVGHLRSTISFQLPTRPFVASPGASGYTQGQRMLQTENAMKKTPRAGIGPGTSVSSFFVFYSISDFELSVPASVARCRSEYPSRFMLWNSRISRWISDNWLCGAHRCFGSQPRVVTRLEHDHPRALSHKIGAWSRVLLEAIVYFGGKGWCLQLSWATAG